MSFASSHFEYDTRSHCEYLMLVPYCDRVWSSEFKKADPLMASGRLSRDVVVLYRLLTWWIVCYISREA